MERVVGHRTSLSSRLYLIIKSELHRSNLSYFEEDTFTEELATQYRFQARNCSVIMQHLS